MVRSRTNPKFYQQLEKSMAQPAVDEEEAGEAEEPAGGELPGFLRSERIRMILVILLCAVYSFCYWAGFTTLRQRRFLSERSSWLSEEQAG